MSHLDKRLVHLAVAVATTLLTACTSEVIAQPASSTATGGGGAMEGSGGQQVTSGSGGGMMAPACSEYLDQPSAGGLLVHIVNNRTTSVFFPGQCFDPGEAPLHIVDGDGTTHPVMLTSSTTTCGAALNGQDAFGGCMPKTMAEIAPGAALDTAWEGQFYDDVELPAECPVPAVLGSHCSQVITPEPGPMVLTVDLADSASNPTFLIKVDAPFVLGTDTSIQVMVN